MYKVHVFYPQREFGEYGPCRLPALIHWLIIHFPRAKRHFLNTLSWTQDTSGKPHVQPENGLTEHRCGLTLYCSNPKSDLPLQPEPLGWWEIGQESPSRSSPPTRLQRQGPPRGTQLWQLAEVSTLFHKGPHSKYLWLCRPDGPSGNLWALPLWRCTVNRCSHVQ